MDWQLSSGRRALRHRFLEKPTIRRQEQESRPEQQDLDQSRECHQALPFAPLILSPFALSLSLCGTRRVGESSSPALAFGCCCWCRPIYSLPSTRPVSHIPSRLPSWPQFSFPREEPSSLFDRRAELLAVRPDRHTAVFTVSNALLLDRSSS